MDQNLEHIPPFLIASITRKCDLHCAGCYSRCNHPTIDSQSVAQLTGAEWLRIFSEVDDLGISFMLLAGGEPMPRRAIIEAAGERQNTPLPIFFAVFRCQCSGQEPAGGDAIHAVRGSALGRPARK